MRTASPLALVPLCSLLLAPGAAADFTTTELVSQGSLERPIHLTAPVADPRLFVCEQMLGQILVFKDGEFLPTPFLDLGGVITTDQNAMGLLGLAFHPRYAINGYFYVVYSDLEWTTTVSRFTVSATDPDVADPSSEVVLLTQPQVQPVHNGGGIAFSPNDGYLYLGFGDGGKALDPDCHGQDLSTWLGKFLRIDVDVDSSHGGPTYAIPPSNPFVGVPGARPEIWSVGWRNPWRFGFDTANGDLYLSDVGQYTREEVDYERAGVGGRNYGWKVEEGAECGQTDLAQCLPFGGVQCGDPHLVQPIHDYTHLSGVGCSVIGGTVYRGDPTSDLWGHYVFGDYCTGRVWSFRVEAGQLQDLQEQTDAFRPENGVLGSLVHVGTDGYYGLYLVDRDGEIFRLTTADHLSANVEQLSAQDGGAQTLAVDARVQHAGRTYVVVGSLSGAEPGLPLGPHHLPLNYDDYMLYSLTHANTPPLVGTVGVLDPAGDATAAFSVPAGSLPPAAVGLTARHAFVVLDGTALVGTSNAVPLEFLP